MRWTETDIAFVEGTDVTKPYPYMDIEGSAEDPFETPATGQEAEFAEDMGEALVAEAKVITVRALDEGKCPGRLCGVEKEPGEKWYEGGIGGWLGEKLYDVMHPEEAKLMNENKINLTVNIDEKGRLTTVSDNMDTRVDGQLNRGAM